MHYKKNLFPTIFLALAVFVPWASPVCGDVQYLEPVRDWHWARAERNLACWTAGTVLYQQALDGEWVPVESEDAYGASGLLSFDPSVRVEIGESNPDFLLQFRNLERVDRLAFRHLGAAGVVGIYAADAPYPADSPRWQKLNGDTEMGAGELVDLKFPLASMRFFRMRFELPAGGAVGPVFLAGESLSAGSGESIPPPAEWPDSPDRVEYDFARLTARGGIAYVGSGNGEESYRMIDGDPTTAFDLGVAPQGAFFIAALAESYPVYQASIVTTGAIGSVEVWTFTSAPDELLTRVQDGERAGMLAIPSEFLTQGLAAARIDVPDDENVTSLTIPLPESTVRYLLVRVVGKSADEPIQVSIFAVLGRVPREYLGNRGNRPAFARPVMDPLDFMDPPRVQFASP